MCQNENFMCHTWLTAHQAMIVMCQFGTRTKISMCHLKFCMCHGTSFCPKKTQPTTYLNSLKMAYYLYFKYCFESNLTLLSMYNIVWFMFLNACSNSVCRLLRISENARKPEKEEHVIQSRDLPSSAAATTRTSATIRSERRRTKVHSKISRIEHFLAKSLRMLK